MLWGSTCFNKFMARETSPLTLLERQVNQIVKENLPVTFQTTHHSVYELAMLMTARLAHLMEKRAQGEAAGKLEEALTVNKKLLSYLPRELVKAGPDNFPRIYDRTQVQFAPGEMQVIAKSAIAAVKKESIAPRGINPRTAYLRFQREFEAGGGVMKPDTLRQVNQTLRR